MAGTDEGLHYPAAVAVHARNRFMSNLLPLMRNATSLRRVVSVFIGGLEGQIKMDDFQGWNMKLMANRDHAASITTLSLESHHKAYPEVSFIHNFPGVIRGGIARGINNPLTTVMSAVLKIFGGLIFMPTEEAGERHVFLATSARYSAGKDDAAPGVPLSDGIVPARGTNGEISGGVYSLDASGESASPAVEQCLAGLRKDGMVERVMDTINTDIEGALQKKPTAKA